MRFANLDSHQLQKVILIGFMGAGKTTLGKLIEQEVGHQLVDLDDWIVERHGKSIPQIFREQGEEGFRKMEREALNVIPIELGEKWVLSCGGGTPCHSDNMEVLNRLGTTIYLKESSEELAARLLPFKEARPLIADIPNKELQGFIDSLLTKREMHYQKAQLSFHAGQWQAFLERMKQVYLQA